MDEKTDTSIEENISSQMNDKPTPDLPWTGERVVPDTPGEEWLFQYHRARYSFAASAIGDGRVLDLGCGAGYGAHLMAQASPNRQVTGIDLSPEAVAFADSRYQLPNLRYVVGDACKPPFSTPSFDYIVCFEVLEHVADAEGLLLSAFHSLKPDGTLIISTPNADVYSKGHDKPWNPYHVQEFSPNEFRKLLGTHFPYVEIYNQSHAVGALISKEEGFESLDLRPDLLASSPSPDPTFMIALCSAVPLPPPSSGLWMMEVKSLEETLETRRRYTEKLKATIDWLSETKRDLQAYQQRVEGHILVRLWRRLQRILSSR